MAKTPISADSHVTEPPHCYVDYIDPAFREIAPRLEAHEKYGDIYVIEGLEQTIPMGLIAAAGKDSKDLRFSGAKFEDLHRSGWDPKGRVADQERDGIAAEILYPTVGMMLCNHPDFDFKKACFDAYNRWLQEYCAEAPDRLHGMAQLAMGSVEEGIADLRRVKDMGIRWVIVNGVPVRRDGKDTAEVARRMPGAVLRNGRAAADAESLVAR